MNYKILKETPDIAKGSVGVPDGVMYKFPTIPPYVLQTRRYPKTFVENNPEWFEPVPEKVCYHAGEWIGIGFYPDLNGIGKVKYAAKGRICFNEVYFTEKFKNMCSDALIEEYTQGCADSYTCEVSTNEIEKFLIEEAERRGFKEGVKVKDKGLRGLSDIFDKKIKYSYNIYGDLLWFRDNTGYAACIYENGKWADIEKNETIKVGGYEVVGYKEGEKVFFTKYELIKYIFVKDQFRHILNFNNFERYLDVENSLNCKIKSITLDSDIVIDIETIKKIVEEADGK